MELVYPPVIAFMRTLFVAQGLKFHVTGAENVPRTGGAVMVINHTGYLEFTYAGYAALPAKRLVRFMAKDVVFAHKLSGPLMRGMKHIPVDRAAGADSYAAAVDSLRNGEIVGVFPEATISRSFELKNFKLGAARMAAEAGVPLLPVVIWGSQRVWTKGIPERLGRHNIPIHIEVGQPIPVSPDEDPAVVTASYKARMQEMLDRVQTAYGPFPPEEHRLTPARLGGTAPTLEEAAVIEQAEVAERKRRHEEAVAKRAASEVR